MSMRRAPIARVTAALITVLALLAAPQAALAQDDNLWTAWVEEVTERDAIEIPFAILFSLPAMIATTPFWLGGLAIEKLSGDDE